MNLKIGDPAPTFDLPNAETACVQLENFRGRWLVIYFYPKDATSGCTLEAREFSGLLDQFKAAGAEVLGVSPDSCKSHSKFIEKEQLSVPLLSDTEKSMLQAYGVWQEKSMYGKAYMGVVRSTFLVDPKGEIAEIWEKVKAPGHAMAVLEKLKILQSNQQ
jgi:thioredoxin-dependent peroxiredoxin